MAFDRIEPLDDGYWQAGLVASTIVNVLGNPRRKTRPEDFVPTKGAPKPREMQSPEEGMAVMRAVAARHKAWLSQQRKET